MTIRYGMTRAVLLVGRWAIKVPRCDYGFEFFVRGWLGNICEAKRWREDSWRPARKRGRLCPVVGKALGGLVIVMARAEDLTGPIPRWWFVEGVEKKPESFGVLEGRVVAVDYA